MTARTLTRALCTLHAALSAASARLLRAVASWEVAFWVCASMLVGVGLTLIIHAVAGG